MSDLHAGDRLAELRERIDAWAYRLLDISALQPITFLGIVWAALSDVVIWGKTSDGWTFVGAAIIVGATSYIAHREARAGGRKT